MKLFDKWTKKMAKTASSAVKEEVKNTAIDLLPTVIGLGGMALGLLVFRNHEETKSSETKKPDYSTTNVTINNYYIGDDVRRMLNNGTGRDKV